MNRRPQALTPALLKRLMKKYEYGSVLELHRRSKVTHSQLQRFLKTGKGLGLKSRMKLANVFPLDREVFAADILAA